MEILHIALVSLGSLVVLFIITKILGNRQVSQLSLFDYIIGITLGSIAAEMATSLEDDFLKPLTAMVVYTVVAALISLAGREWQKARELLEGRPVVLFEDGRLYKHNLRKSKMTLNEFLCAARVAGYFDLNDIQAAVLEHNGEISFLPTAKARPLNPEDMGLVPQPEQLCHNLIMDGRIIEHNLHRAGFDEVWLDKQLHAKDVKDVKDVLLGFYDGKELTVYLSKAKPDSEDTMI